MDYAQQINDRAVAAEQHMRELSGEMRSLEEAYAALKAISNPSTDIRKVLKKLRGKYRALQVKQAQAQGVYDTLSLVQGMVRNRTQ